MPVSLTAVCSDDPDEVFEFHTDGQSRQFGRDDTQCEIVVWSQLNGNDLSRVAGRLWRMDGEIWLRNLSQTHDLSVSVPGQASGELLPPRRGEGPGPARSLPVPVAVVSGPGGWTIEVRQQLPPSPVNETVDGWQATRRLPPVPKELRPLAQALCRPIMDGGRYPATYREMVADLGGDATIKKVRDGVAALLRVYEEHLPGAEERAERRRQEEEARLAFEGTVEKRPGGVLHLKPSDVGAAKKPLSLHAPPSYDDLAHVLTRHQLIVRQPE